MILENIASRKSIRRTIADARVGGEIVSRRGPSRFEPISWIPRRGMRDIVMALICAGVGSVAGHDVNLGLSGWLRSFGNGAEDDRGQ